MFGVELDRTLPESIAYWETELVGANFNIYCGMSLYQEIHHVRMYVSVMSHVQLAAKPMTYELSQF